MIRIYLTSLAIFLIPLALYVAYIYFSLGKQAVRERLTVKALGVLACLGAALTIFVVVFLTDYTGADPDGIYEPARIEDGRIVPGRFVEPDRSSSD